MKKTLLTVLIASCAFNLSLGQTATYASYDVVAANGNGVRFWQGDNWKIHMGNLTEYHYGPVTDYSIKMNMDATSGRGWTWGLPGSTPVAALGNQGNMQIASSFTAGGNIVNNSIAYGWLGLTGDLPGYSNGTYPTLKTSSDYLYFSTYGKYSGYLGGGSGNAVLGLNDASASVKVFVNTNGNTYLNGGNVGIGTTSPSAKLHLSAASRTQALRVYMDGNTSNYLSLGQGSGGAVIDPIGTGMLYLGYDQSTNVILGYGGGKVGIGTGSPDYPLTVNGSIHAKEVRVDLNVPAPDYVFEKDYKLTSLEDIKTYIDQNKHLPEVPSAKEIEKNGVQLGEMNMILLKKIEELTLYVIELKKESEAQNKLIKELINKNN